MNRYIKKADILLFIVILVIGMAVSFWTLSGSDAGERAVVTVDGRLYGTYPLMQDQEIDVRQNGHQNHITIKDGQVSMTFSDCHNQVCVNTGKISKTSQTIVCLPNKVMVEIVSDEGGEADVVTG